MIKGIDVSAYQKKPDWGKVVQSGVQFAIIRIANKNGKDPSFEHNYEGCYATGIAKGVYRFCYALSATEARKEAQEVLDLLVGRKLEMGVWLDLEWDRLRALGSAKVKEIANAWMQVIRDGGYECNIYCNIDWHRNVCGGLNAKYWIARYAAKDNGTVPEHLRPNVGEIGWQYSSKGSVPGISGNVDLDQWYETPGIVDATPEEDEREMDSATVRSFQEAANADGITDSNGKPLQVDGIAGRRTAEVVKKTLLKAGALNGTTGRLSVGSTGQLVKWLQMRLDTLVGDLIVAEIGHGVSGDGHPDGKFGADTEKAVKLFQWARGLKDDGKAGVDTITELFYPNDMNRKRKFIQENFIEYDQR